MFGVSPAIMVSLYGTQFNIDDFCNGLEQVSELGFQGFQPEIFTPDALRDWQCGGAKRVASVAESLGLIPTQFVAHFMMKYFSSAPMLHQQDDVDVLKRVIETARSFPACRILTVPLPKFQLPESFDGSKDLVSDLLQRFEEKLKTYLDLITDAGLKLALELLPGCLIGGTQGFLSLAQRMDHPGLGVNLDTGHAWACREPVPIIPLQLGDKLFGTHLCDNNSDVNASLAPGEGTLNWNIIMDALEISGYKGSLDIEIVCEPGNVKTHYANGLSFLQKKGG